MQQEPKPPLLTKDVLEVFDGNQSELARFLNITRASIGYWGEEVPLLRQYQLRERLPAIDSLVAAIRKTRKKKLPE